MSGLRLNSALTILALLWLLATVGSPVHAQPPKPGEPLIPITGLRVDSVLANQQVRLQHTMERVFPESDGFFVTGPLEAWKSETKEDWDKVLHSVRVVCPDIGSLLSVKKRLKSHKELLKLDAYRENVEKPRRRDPAGYRGVIALIKVGGAEHVVQFMTLNQLRWLLWQRRCANLLVNRFAETGDISDESKALVAYEMAVSDYLYQVDTGAVDIECVPPRNYGLDDAYNIYAPPPDYVIQGYQNYKDSIAAHRAIYTDFTRGVISFIPSDSLLGALKANAPREAYRNKEWPHLQHEFREFVGRGGSLSMMNSLTRAGFDTLQTGEYFFAVSPSMKIRFGRELSREAADGIEGNNGLRLPPRANHAFLFPGEPILTAGAFFIERDSVPRIVAVNAQSGHYFYSNVTSSIVEDIAVQSDHYLLSLGHFFAAITSLGIDSPDISISKF